MDAITTRGLTKIFPGKRGTELVALDRLDLKIAKGEAFGFLGPNGAGKSTTIKLLMGLIKPTTGSGSIGGIDMTHWQARARVGYLPENPSFYEYLNAEEYLAFVGSFFQMPAAEIHSRAEAILKRLTLWEARKRPLRSYSKGMVQRLGLAQVLLHNPDIFILDEPMSGLDPLGRALVKEIIRELKEAGKCIFFSTHITSDVEAVCDRVGIILNGRLRTVENVETIMANGITGYHIRYRRPSAEVLQETSAKKEQLPEILAQLHLAGDEIVLLEPQRKDLEKFFLEIVQQNNDAN
ncbi:MAG: ABC transporter ATP-binding protein [Thermodesulfobacteriota bacterium]